MDFCQEEYSRTEYKVQVKVQNVLELLEESERSFDRAIDDFSRGMEKMFAALKIMTEQTEKLN